MSYVIRAVVAAAIVFVALASRALAAEPPSYFALPDGMKLGFVEYRSYGWMEIPPGREVVKGHFWRIHFAVPKGSKPSAIVPALEAKGWRIDASDPVVHARFTDGTHTAWLTDSAPGSATVVEKSEPRSIELAPPGPTPEELQKNADAPYFKPWPGLTMRSWELVRTGSCDVRNPVIKGIDHAGPPAVNIGYSGSLEEVSALEEQEGYVAALGRAGWDVVSTGMAGLTTAHYAKHGRDLWLHFGPGEGHLNVCIADVGAAAAANRLKQALDEVGHVALYGIYFDLDKAMLRSEAEATLEQIRALLVKYGELQLEIQGHTDNTGTHDHNQTLSAERAASVKAWLVAHGIAAARLTTAGYAETKPVATNTTAEGRQLNRRVELAKQ